MLACLLCGVNSILHMWKHMKALFLPCGVYCFLVGGAVANVNPFFLRAAALLPHGLRFAN